MKTIFRLVIVSFMTTIPAIAQQPAALTAADYARAEKWMGYNTNPLVYRSGIRPTWQADDRFCTALSRPRAANS